MLPYDHPWFSDDFREIKREHWEEKGLINDFNKGLHNIFTGIAKWRKNILHPGYKAMGVSATY